MEYTQRFNQMNCKFCHKNEAICTDYHLQDKSWYKTVCLECHVKMVKGDIIWSLRYEAAIKRQQEKDKKHGKPTANELSNVE